MDQASQLLQQAVFGIAQGSVYALIALGYTMVYGVLRLINFAHGDVFALGAYLGLATTIAYGFSPGTEVPLGLLPFLMVFLAAMLGCAVTGITMERFAYRPLRRAPRMAALITAIGVSLLLENLGIVTVSATPRPFPQFTALFPPQARTVGGGLVTVTAKQVWVPVVAVLLMVLLYGIVKYTRFGKAMRAVAQDLPAAQLMGINTDRVIMYTFGLGSLLAGAGGVLYGLYYVKIDPLMGIMVGLKAFIAAVLGGIGSVPGAMAGGILMGLAETGVAATNIAVPGGRTLADFKDAVAFVVIILVLLIRPRGLFGKVQPEKV